MRVGAGWAVHVGACRRRWSGALLQGSRAHLGYSLGSCGQGAWALHQRARPRAWPEAQTCAHKHTRTHTGKHAHTNTHAHTHSHTHAHTHAHTHPHAHTRTHAHTHTCTHTHAQAAKAAAAAPEEEEGEGEGGAPAAASASFDYLLSMAIYSLTWEKVQALEEEADMQVGRASWLRLGMGRDGPGLVAGLFWPSFGPLWPSCRRCSSSYSGLGHACACVHAHIICDINTRAHTHTRTHTNTCTRTHTHTHTHTCALRRRQPWPTWPAPRARRCGRRTWMRSSRCALGDVRVWVGGRLIGLKQTGLAG